MKTLKMNYVSKHVSLIQEGCCDSGGIIYSHVSHIQSKCTLITKICFVWNIDRSTIYLKAYFKLLENLYNFKEVKVMSKEKVK